jgi:predicted transcriptional regulator
MRSAAQPFVPRSPVPGSPVLAATVGDVMTSTLRVARRDMALDALLGLLLDEGIGGAPVVDDVGRLVGMVSRTDVLRTVQDGRPLAAVAVGDVMTSWTFTVEVDAPVERAAALLAFEGVHRLAVLRDDGALVGLVTPMDITRALALGAGYSP